MGLGYYLDEPPKVDEAMLAELTSESGKDYTDYILYGGAALVVLALAVVVAAMLSIDGSPPPPPPGWPPREAVTPEDIGNMEAD